MLGISPFSFRLIVGIGVCKILIGNRFVSLGVELHSIKILVDIINHVLIAEGVFIQHLTRAAPSGIGVHKNLFGILLLGGQGLIHRHPVYLLGRGGDPNKQQNKKCYILHWKFH